MICVCWIEKYDEIKFMNTRQNIYDNYEHMNIIYELCRQDKT